MAHRPLSMWVTAVPLSPDGAAAWADVGDINFGAERSDARQLPVFATGWQRLDVPLDGDRVLGLVRGDEAVLELDELARPIPVTPEGAAALAAMESRGIHGPPREEEVRALQDERVAVRHLLASRLAEEDEPFPGLFHLLPWHLVDDLVLSAWRMLNGEPPGRVIELENWFVAVGSRFSAALEQLDEGLRDPDDEVARVGATALCARLLPLDPARIPERTRVLLADLLGGWRERDPFIADAARRAGGHLLFPGAGSGPGPLRQRQLPAAAADGPAVRRASVEQVRPPFTIVHTMQSTHKAMISVEARVDRAARRWLETAYGVLFAVIAVTTADEESRYLLPLQPRFSRLEGLIEVPYPRIGAVEVDMDGPPIGVAEAGDASPDEVRRSIRALPNARSRTVWRQFAERLRPGHPLRGVVAGAVT